MDYGKARYDLIPPNAIDGAARAFTHGAHKYSPNNWEGMEYSRIYASIQRHLWEFWMGGGECCDDDRDGDSGLPILAHALAALMMLYESWDIGIGRDDRPAVRRNPDDDAGGV